MSAKAISPVTLIQQALFSAMRDARADYDSTDVAKLFQGLDEGRVRMLTARLREYIAVNLPKAIDRRTTLQHYRTNPYVLLTCGSLMRLADPHDFATFVVNNKLYMGLETSFGKSIESIVMGGYPIQGDAAWHDPHEKLAESSLLKGLTREAKARERGRSIWREIDKTCVVGRRRYMVSIKSGPNTVNDTQVNAMKDAIAQWHSTWLAASQDNYHVDGIDIVLGLTYGTNRTTNNKDNQLIVKLLDYGFENSPLHPPGVLLDSATGLVRVYRVVGANYWSFVAAPDEPSTAPHAFLEVLLALAMALRVVAHSREVESRLNSQLALLATAIGTLHFPKASLPLWVKQELDDDHLFLMAGALSAFFDAGL